MKRKELKKRAKFALKKHYFIYVAICLIAAYLGSEFTSSLNWTGIKPVSTKEYEQTFTLSVGGLSVDTSLSDVMSNVLSGNEEEARGLAEELKEDAIEKASEGNPAFGRTRGVFASIVNMVTSGSLFVTVVTAINSALGTASFSAALFTILGLLLPFLLWFFLSNMYIVISRRMFLEGRQYEKLPLSRFIFLLRVKRWLKTCWSMAVVSIFQTLWILTIIGGIIKHYSYFMVPYILAENPDIGTLQAITLSRKMMNGHKWECFIFRWSFIPWDLLGIFTLGLSNVFMANSYKIASFCEYYVNIRSEAKQKAVPNADLLCDTYLYENAAKEDIEAAYADVLAVLEQPQENVQRPRGFRGFLADWFGIRLTNTQAELAYERAQAEQMSIRSLRDDVEGRAYPGRLFIIPEPKKVKRVETLDYLKAYSIWSLVLMFFIFSMIGWLWEVSLHLITNGEFVNRGTMHGPWLPIYGSGGLLILIILKKLRAHPVAEFISAVILCGTVEYFSAYMLELMHDGQKWWDYSGYFLNLHGRICAEGLLIFGIGGVMIVYVLAPMLDQLISRINKRLLVVICVILLAAFGADRVYSTFVPNAGKGITSASVQEPATVLAEEQMILEAAGVADPLFETH